MQGLELVVRDLETLAGFDVLDLRTPVGHAHRLVTEQTQRASVIEDFVADLHCRKGEAVPSKIGTPAPPVDP